MRSGWIWNVVEFKFIVGVVDSGFGQQWIAPPVRRPLNCVEVRILFEFK